MKYAALFIVAGTLFLICARHPAATAAAAPAEPKTDFLKSPIDRTHQVLQINRDRVDDPALK